MDLKYLRSEWLRRLLMKLGNWLITNKESVLMQLINAAKLAVAYDLQ